MDWWAEPSLPLHRLKMGLIRSGQTKLTPEDDDELTAYLWPIVREIIKTAIENQQSLIVEGCYVPFEWRRDFTDDCLVRIRFLCLTMTDEYIDAHLDEIRDHACDVERRLDDSYCTADLLKTENRKYAEGFRAAGEKVVRIERDYNKTIGSLLN